MRAEFTLRTNTEDFDEESVRISECTGYENSLVITIDGLAFSLDKDDLRKVLAILD